MTEPVRLNPDDLTVKELQSMLAQEVTNVAKASELRIREFTAMTKAYEAGEITPEQAMNKVIKYQDKWGDAVPGVYSVAGKTDEEIIAAATAYTEKPESLDEMQTRFREIAERRSGQTRNRS